MDPILTAVGSNIVVATALAAVALIVSRLGRWPQVAHVLWLLVLIKLITPPVVTLSVSMFESGRRDQATNARVSTHVDGAYAPPTNDVMNDEAPPFDSTDSADQQLVTAGGAQEPFIAPPRPTAPMEVISVPHSGTTTTERGERNTDEPQATTVLASQSHGRQRVRWNWRATTYAVWLAGALVYAAVLVRRYGLVRRLLAKALIMDKHVVDATRRLAEQVGLAKCPDVRVVDARIPPLVWGPAWRPAIVLPESLLHSLNREQRDAVLVHELAHVLRRDHLVRWLEMLVLVPFWWNPLAWWARREVRRAEEECCDAYVVWLLPESRRVYGQALLATVEFLSSGTQVVAPAGSAFGKPFFKRRIEMILSRDMRPKLSWSGWCALAILAATVVPVGAQSTASDDQPDQSNKPSVASASDDALAREIAERERLSGGWKVVAMAQNGEPTPSEFEYYHWHFDGDASKAGTAWKRENDEAHQTEEARQFRFVVNPDASPKELTIYGDNMLIQAIYRLEDDALTICFYGRSEKDRPAQFPDAEGRRNTSSLPVMEFKLAKDASVRPMQAMMAGAEQTADAEDVARTLENLWNTELERRTKADQVAFAQAAEQLQQQANAESQNVLQARISIAEEAYRSAERMAQRGYISQAELARSRAELAQAQSNAERSTLQREADGQLLELDVAEAKVKLQAAEAQLKSMQQARAARAITEHDLAAKVYDVELARIALQRAEIKLKLHRQQGAVE